MNNNGNKFTSEEQREIADSIERNKQEVRRKNDNFSTIFGIVWILVAVLLAKTTDLGIILSGIIGLIAGWFVASRLK
ncbi:hypothetical protein [Yersinia enterocolitica]|uniref:hypothetical protein n=1 Tax=Yersinia enterocolitica TaxID=630 RepID=UPI0009F3E8B7|nr:hypothetical protein [Yersinia enterocolitica]PNM18888.1 hypothetical protein A6J65_008375 [Yersinia enterocolitica]HDL7734734.1 hypothetical protein [Yersinia enterocolitica]HDL8479351.1 hypothetical protein [Yersinia enterocolitica]HDL8507672.1 hypothetical protein [Yersinia enterocolitica]HEK6321224.1 hypothetical protein [Yersinia enterocolitica]